MLLQSEGIIVYVLNYISYRYIFNKTYINYENLLPLKYLIYTLSKSKKLKQKNASTQSGYAEDLKVFLEKIHIESEAPLLVFR
jgi:hypothetical protein